MLDALISAIPLILSLAFLETMLSIDNALVIATKVAHLADPERKRVLRVAAVLGYVMRFALILIAAWLVANPWIKVLGAIYLLYVMCSELGATDEQHKAALSSKGGLLATIVAVEITDLMFSVDNVLAAVSLSPKLWVVCTGVLIGVIAMRLIASSFVKLIERLPVLEQVAYVLVGFIGVQLLAEHYLHLELSELEKFGGIFTIALIGIGYVKLSFLNAVLRPVFGALVVVMRLLARVADIFLWPVRALFGLICSPWTR
jgi:tellurite resistance protein TerC